MRLGKTNAIFITFLLCGCRKWAAWSFFISSKRMFCCCWLLFFPFRFYIWQSDVVVPLGAVFNVTCLRRHDGHVRLCFVHTYAATIVKRKSTLTYIKTHMQTLPLFDSFLWFHNSQVNFYWAFILKLRHRHIYNLQFRRVKKVFAFRC